MSVLSPSAEGRAYDEMPYPGLASAPTHPHRLAAMARLFGLNPVPTARASVLELGCADGTNLLPMAEALPEASFLGIDASQVQIAAGLKAVAALGLGNLELRCEDILTFLGEGRQFDYIIVHGLFSWVPDAVREKILQIAGRQLKPHGVAFVSYNAQPGGSVREWLRNVARLYAGGGGEVRERVRGARQAFELLASGMADEPSPHSHLLKTVLQHAATTPDSYFRHEYLGDENTAFYFMDFVERAQRHGLQYLGEPTLKEVLPDAFSPAARAAINRVASLLEREQLMDFIRNRGFRHTLLCRADATLDRRIPASRMRDLAFRSRLVDPLAAIDLTEGTNVTFTQKDGGVFHAAGSLTKAALQLLMESPGCALAYPNLLAQARERAPVDGRNAPESEDRLQTHLLTLFGNGAFEIFSDPIRTATQVPARPHAPAWARYQARLSQRITNRMHEMVDADAGLRVILELCDGRRTQAEIFEALMVLVREAKISPPGNPADYPATMHRVLADALGVLVAMHLLA